MATLLKFVAFFESDAGYGWSEVHYKLSSSDNPLLKTQLDSYFGSVVPARQNMLGQDCALVGARVSYPRAGAIASLGRRDYYPGNPAFQGSAAQLSLAINFADVTNTKARICHLRGFWDVIEFNESYHPESPLAAGWQQALINWKAALIQGAYGWPTKDPANSARGNMLDYLQLESGQVGFTLGGPGMPAFTIGTTQQISFARINRSNSVLNKPILCYVNDATHVTSVGQHACGPQQSGGTYNFRATTFTAYNDTGSISIGRRQMGRPLFRSPGRSKAKPQT